MWPTRRTWARQTYTVDGTGIGIGVISDGVETLADQQATGDVPARVMVLPGQEGGSFDLACGGRSSGTEGTAMIEIVHDLAPGADLFFADGGGGRAQMAQNIEDLCAAGANIIVDDIGYLGASAFQDDVIAKAISAAAANGCFYFSSAGNSGNLNDATAGGLGRRLCLGRDAEPERTQLRRGRPRLRRRGDREPDQDQ